MSDFEKIGLMQMKTYKLEEELLKDTIKAVRKSQYKEPIQEPLVIARKSKPILYRDTPEFIGKLQMREFELNQKLMNDTNNALSITTEYSKPGAVFSTVTSDMIEDQKIMEYVPLDIKIDLEKPSLIKLPTGLLTVEKLDRNLEKARDEYDDAIAELDENLAKINEKKTNITEKYNTKISELNELLDLPRTEGGKPAVKQQKKEINEEYNKNISELMAESNDIRALKSVQQADLEGIILQTEQYKKDIEENEIEIERVNRNNLDKLQQYADDLVLLNPALANVVVKKTNESIEQYKNRLQSLEIPISPEQKRQKEELLAFTQAKRNLKEFFNDAPRVELLTKRLEDRNEFNKMFPKIKTDYLSRYGVDNKQITNSEVIDYISEAIKQPNFLSPIQTPEPEDGQQIGPVVINGSEYYSSSYYKRSTLNDIADANNVPRTGTKVQLYERLLMNGFLPKKGGAPRMPRVPTHAPYIFPTITEETPAEMVGVGVKKYPKMSKLGKVNISLDDLYYKNMLKIRLPNKRSIIGFPNKRISDILVSIIMKLIENSPITKSDLNFLKPEERVIYDKLLVLSGLHKTVSNTFEETIEEMKQRLRLIEGQLSAGNDNPAILKEAHTILHGMSACGLISGNAASRYYKELKSK